MIPFKFSPGARLLDLNNFCIENDFEVIGHNGQWFLDFEIKEVEG